MEEKIMAELAEIKKLTLLGAKNILTLEDVSQLLNISKSSLYKMTCNRRIPHYKKNAKMLFFDKAEIEEWAKQNRVNTIEEAEQSALAYTLKK